MKIRIGAWLVMLAAAFAVAGCGAGDDETVAPSVDVTGTWVGATDTGVPIQMALTQVGNNVQGSTVDGALIGFISSNEFDATIVYSNGPSVTLEATILGSSMSGDYAVEGRSTDTFTATRK